MNSFCCACTNSSGGVRGGTKPLSTSTRCTAWPSAVEELASLQQASGSLHDEASAGPDRGFPRRWKSERGVW